MPGCSGGSNRSRLMTTRLAIHVRAGLLARVRTLSRKIAGRHRRHSTNVRRVTPRSAARFTSTASRAAWRRGASIDVFELCSVLCRSNSRSLVHENAYRHERHHCYGGRQPPFDRALHRGVFDFASPVATT
ncbi:hypothetical protein FGB62_25g040 [Gracilaria domingensis]|nr:hypothetical protein FGB62_25g040 [Gracilaria domingensis]